MPINAQLCKWQAVFVLLGALPGAASAAPMTLFDGRGMAAIVHPDTPTGTLAARLLARDLTALTGRAPRLATSVAGCGARCIVLRQGQGGGWEQYRRSSQAGAGQQRLIIEGSDQRGMVWGVIDLTRELGVSAWEWWADVAPRRRSRLVVDGGARQSASPSVQYRGIFLNDEDWGLQPWAAKTFDPAGDIGPATYARIYELMWRLKANTIWPAMHDVTKPFYQMPGNPAMARDYAIVVGTSHAEPMMRNNVREWDAKTRGRFNFFTNRDNMLRYWQERIDQLGQQETIVSVGLRGVHDSAMEGATSVAQARDGVAEVIGLQRAMLGPRPQALTLYKEVLDIYKAGLKVPEDVTLVWPDDNYGYLHQLSTPAEGARPGGAGLYYHLSYWGRPHDYLWLGTTHPALVRDQLQRAVFTGARKLWVANVGDIKPLEYLTQYFLDLAFDNSLLAQDPQRHLLDFMARQFGEQAGAIASIKQEYYALAWERRPEFMGFGQTEPTTPNRTAEWSMEQATARLARYGALVARAEAVASALPADRRAAFFQLVLYPVRASASMNLRTLSLQMGGSADAARAAHAALEADTAYYNGMQGGKWRHMMDMAPRRLPVFRKPEFVARPQLLAQENITVIDAGKAAAGWEALPQLGLRSRLDGEPGEALEYTFNGAELTLVAVPTHPLTSAHGVRLKYSIDGGAEQVADFQTHGRSEEWKRNVLTNTARRTIKLPAGLHNIKIRALDPGVILNRLEVR